VSFWDTSAIIPLLLAEPSSGAMRALAQETPVVVVWWGTPVEVLSTVARRVRDGGLSHADADRVRDRLTRLSLAWTEVLPGDRVREHAGRLLRRHPLRAADALQLGAAMTWADGRPDGHPFISLDTRLSEAARGEGFGVPPEGP
jgi:predicted nucleic acid-binding protein